MRWQGRVRGSKVLLSPIPRVPLVELQILLLLLLLGQGSHIVQLLRVLHAVLLELGRDEVLQSVISLGDGILGVLQVAQGVILVRQGSHIFRKTRRSPGNRSSRSSVLVLLLVLLDLVLLLLLLL